MQIGNTTNIGTSKVFNYAGDGSTTQEKIASLEEQITPRRYREALLGNAESVAFIVDIEAKINELKEVI